MSFLTKNSAAQFAATLLAAALLAPGSARAGTQTALYNFAPNATDEGRKLNRRVDLVVAMSPPPEKDP